MAKVRLTIICVVLVVLTSPVYAQAPACGDAVLDRTEECDDGNVLSGDGCSATCEVELLPLGLIRAQIAALQIAIEEGRGDVVGIRQQISSLSEQLADLQGLPFWIEPSQNGFNLMASGKGLAVSSFEFSLEVVYFDIGEVEIEIVGSIPLSVSNWRFEIFVDGNNIDIVGASPTSINSRCRLFEISFSGCKGKVTLVPIEARANGGSLEGGVDLSMEKIINVFQAPLVATFRRVGRHGWVGQHSPASLEFDIFNIRVSHSTELHITGGRRPYTIQKQVGWLSSSGFEPVKDGLVVEVEESVDQVTDMSTGQTKILPKILHLTALSGWMANPLYQHDSVLVYFDIRDADGRTPIFQDDGALVDPALMIWPIYGDPSSDGQIGMADVDAILTSRILPHPLSAGQKYSADVSGSGSVSAYDAALIMQYLYGLISVFPVEGIENVPESQKGAPPKILSFSEIIVQLRADGSVDQDMVSRVIDARKKEFQAKLLTTWAGTFAGSSQHRHAAPCLRTML